MNFDFDTITKIVYYTPLWVALIVFSFTQMTKGWLRAIGVNDLQHRYLVRLLSACVGGLSGFLLIDMDPVKSIGFGVAIAAVISIIYVPVTRQLASMDKPWAKALAQWMKGQ